MNPNANQPSFELPTPQPMPGGETAASAPEQVAANPETQNQPPVAQPNPAPASPPMPPAAPQQAFPTTPMPPTTGTVAATPLVAEDSDLIEKEWVVKAKQIVAATREDPHLQNKEMSRFKADYLKKRYNKDIKLEEN